ncbi:MAG TPA: hypothetical protein VHZ28_14415 [Terracidiphilus sp.]|jgi:hypothetical protein|nr:hypothetical protein [Terracidiphilus sp.]
MSEKLRSTHTQPGGFETPNPKLDDEIVNDSLGTTDVADSTGTDPAKETGDAKVKNKNTRED